MKFGRAYRLRIWTEQRDNKGNTVLDPQGNPIVTDEVIITNPITIRFTVSRHTSNALNEMKADLYNLSENVRNFLFQEPYFDQKKKISFEGGYDSLSLLYLGEIWWGTSYRQGSDIITSIEAKAHTYDLYSKTIYETLPADMTVGQILRDVVGRFGADLPIGAIGDYPEKLSRPCVLNGNCWDLTKKLSDNTAYVDNGKIYILKQNEAIEGEIFTINAETGLLATPRRIGNTFLQVQTLFEPRLILKQLLTVDSKINSVYSGTYEIMGLQHTGIISEAVGGDLRTIIDLFLDGKGFRTVPLG